MKMVLTLLQTPIIKVKTHQSKKQQYENFNHIYYRSNTGYIVLE